MEHYDTRATSLREHNPLNNEKKDDKFMLIFFTSVMNTVSSYPFNPGVHS